MKVHQTETMLMRTINGKQIIQNEAQCMKCGDIIVSKHVHDFVQCRCGAIFVDGGMEYLRRGGEDEDFIDRSLMMNKNALNECINAVVSAEENNKNGLGIALAVIRTLRDFELLNKKELYGSFSTKNN